MTKLGRTFVALDTEATGLRADLDEIIEIGAVKFRDGAVIDRWQSFIRPSQPIPYKISTLTGITWQDVRNAPPIATVAPRLVQFIGDNPIVGQSIEVDLAMLNRQGVRIHNRSFDTFELATLLLPEVPVYNLAGVARALKIEVPRAHRALDDAELAMYVFQGLIARLEELPLEVLSEINRATVNSEWGLRHLFQDVEREAARHAFEKPLASASSIREKLAAQGLSQTELELGILRPAILPDPLPDLAESLHKTIDEDELAQMLEPGGAMEQAFPNYEYRPQQVEMMRSVARAFNDKKHLMVEAGTGTGKSLAYLLPAIQYAVANNTRVVISTNTINLQEQIFSKDIPTLQAMLSGSRETSSQWSVVSGQDGEQEAGSREPGSEEAATDNQQPAPNNRQPATGNRQPRPGSRLPAPGANFTSALLKGRSNYLCLRRWGLYRKQVAPASIDELRLLAKVLIWLPTTNSGDRSELLLANHEPAIWSRISVTEEGCPLYECMDRQKGLCFFQRAKHRAEGANVLVVNHALLLADIATGHKVLPPYKHLIIDEAHNLEEEATNQLGYEVSQSDLLDLLNQISRPAGPERYDGFLEGLRRMIEIKAPTDAKATLASALNSKPKIKLPRNTVTNITASIDEINPACERARFVAIDLFSRLSAALEQGSEEKNEYDKRLRVTTEVRRSALWGEVEMTWDNLSLILQTIVNSLDDIMTALEQEEASEGELADELLELQNLWREAYQMQSQMNDAMLNPSAGAIYWLSSNARENMTTLHSAPLHVGQLLDRFLFQSKSTVVMTSATLSTDGSFDYVRERVGMHNGSELQVHSPFDYVNSTMLYVADDLPEPNQPGYQRALEQTILELCKATQGRALILFTSHSALRTTYRAIQRPLEQAGLLVLGHNIDGSRRQLLDHFKSSPRTVLLGTSSFWEGIDVIGDALSVLVIAKLPFKVPSDPIFAARSEQFDDPFLQYSVPQTIIKFKQGFGRLIRSKTDRGVVAVLDKRVISKRYGQTFINSLPLCTQVNDAANKLPQVAIDWLTRNQENLLRDLAEE